MIAEIVSLPGYENKIAALMDEDERMAMEFFIATTAEDHPVMKATGGFRKARWARPGGGKSGGFRAIYFFLAKPGLVYMASVYPKSSKENLTAREKQLLDSLSKAIRAAAQKESSK